MKILKIVVSIIAALVMIAVILDLHLNLWIIALMLSKGFKVTWPFPFRNNNISSKFS